MAKRLIPRIHWDEWRGSLDGRPTLWVKHLFCRRGRHVDIHKMIAVDDPKCFHTHPAYAVRVILWGGYVEETEDGALHTWRPGMVGIVAPALCHRIAELRNGRVSYSLWIRFRKRAQVQARGNGWHLQAQTHLAPGVVIVRDEFDEHHELTLPDSLGG